MSAPWRQPNLGAMFARPSARSAQWLWGGIESVVAVLVLVVPLWVAGLPEPRPLATALWSICLCASLVFRRSQPLIALLVAGIAGVGLLTVMDRPVPAAITAVVVMYSVARYEKSAMAYLSWPVAIAGSAVASLSWSQHVDADERFAAELMAVAMSLSLFATAWLAGRYRWYHQRVIRLEDQLTEQAFHNRSARSAQDSQLAEGKARAEVARELHDVVAHSLSVIVVQAEGARALAAKKPEATQAALEVIARTGRTSIHEMRRIVGLLRGETDADFGPTPSLPQIPEMVAKAGERITLEIPDQAPPVPESLGLTAFRVVQESVTNFLKHAGPTAVAHVFVDYRPSSIVVHVTDDGLGGQAPGPRQGAGLRGMRERVQAMGGSLHAGPRSGGGYEVKAELPLPSQLGRGWMEES